MKILQIISRGGMNGAVRYAIDEAQLLAERGHEVVVLTRPGETFAPSDGPAGYEVWRSDLSWRLAEFRRVRDLCRERRIDVIHTHMSDAHAFGVIQRVLYGTPCVATAHALFVQAHWRLNDLVLCHNTASMDFERRWNRVPSRKLRLISAFIDGKHLRVPEEPRATTRARLGLPQDRVLLTTLGNAAPRKGIHDLVEALPVVLRENPNVTLAICGWEHEADYRQKLESRIEKLGIAGHVVWLERLADADVAHLLRASDLTVQASRKDTGPLVILEAMSLGVPSVGTRMGSMPLWIAPGETGELADVGNPASLAAAIVRALRAPLGLKAMGDAARARYNAQFQTSVAIAHIERALADAAGKTLGAVAA